MSLPALDRRAFLGSGLGALGGLLLGARGALGAPRWILPPERAGQGTARNLVLVQLSGGNDGLSTVVPWADDAYGRARQEIRVAEGEVLRLDDYRGLHPNLGRLKRLWDDGYLAIVEGCGYPEPVRSHFKSLEIWHTGRLIGRASGPGWIGRLAEGPWRDDPTTELVVHVGANAPYSVFSNERPAISFSTPQGYRWVEGDGRELAAWNELGEARDGGSNPALARVREVLRDARDSSVRVRQAWAAYRTETQWPGDELGQSLKVVSALIDAGLGTRVFSVELGGFDTHETQRRRHDGLMRTLDNGLATFFEERRGRAAFDDTLVVVFSEFGRRLKENASKGTDHGVAAPMLVLGAAVKGGLHGRHPSLVELDDGDLVHTTDFRSVYGTVVERWFGLPQEKALDARYPLIELV
jgi:uncharacterized protein (DUF1501 family)